MSFWKGLARGFEDADAKKEREKAVELQQKRLGIEDARYEAERQYRAGRDKITDANTAAAIRRQKDKDMAAAGFVFDEEKGGYVHQSQRSAAGYNTGGRKMTPEETREAAAAKLNIDREVKNYYATPAENATMAPGSKVMTEADKAFFETLASDPRTQAEVNKWYVANKDKYGLTIDMLPTLYTLDVQTGAGQEALAAVIGVDDAAGLSKAVALAQSVVPPGTFATLDQNAMPMSMAEEDKQYSYSKERLAADLAREQIKRADAGLSTTRITQIIRDLENSGTEGAAFQSGIMELGGPDYLIQLEDSGDQRWANLTKNSWFSPLLEGATPEGVDEETVKPGDIVTGSDGSSYLVSTGDDGQVVFKKTEGVDLLPPAQVATAAGPGNTPVTTPVKPVVDRRLAVGEAERVSAIEETLTAEQEGETIKTESGANYTVTVTEGGAVRLVPTEVREISPELAEMEALLSPSDIGEQVTVGGKTYTVTKSTDTGLPILTEVYVEPSYQESLTREGERLGKEAIKAEGDKLVNRLLNSDITEDEGERLIEEFADRYGEEAAAALIQTLQERTEVSTPQAPAGRNLDADLGSGFDANRTPTVSMAIAEDVRKAIERKDETAVEKLIETHGAPAVEAALNEAEAAGYTPSPEPIANTTPTDKAYDDKALKEYVKGAKDEAEVDAIIKAFDEKHGDGTAVEVLYPNSAKPVKAAGYTPSEEPVGDEPRVDFKGTAVEAAGYTPSDEPIPASGAGVDLDFQGATIPGRPGVQTNRLDAKGNIQFEEMSEKELDTVLEEGDLSQAEEEAALDALLTSPKEVLYPGVQTRRLDTKGETPPKTEAVDRSYDLKILKEALDSAGDDPELTARIKEMWDARYGKGDFDKLQNS